MKSSLNQKYNTNLIAIIAVFIPILLAVFLWLIGILDKSASSDQIATALISLCGTFLIGIFGFIGVLVKQTIEKRTLSISEQSEKRLRLETAIKIIELLKTDKSEAQNNETIEASLLALSSLGEINLALNLVENYWEVDLVKTKVAVNIINNALINDSINTQDRAVTILDKNFKKLIYEEDNQGHYYFPYTVYLKWNKDINLAARRSLMTILMKCLAEKPRSFWKKDVLNEFAYNFYKIMLSDPTEDVKLGAAFCIQKFIKKNKPLGEFVTPDTIKINSDKILNKANELIPKRNDVSGKITTENINLISKIAEL